MLIILIPLFFVFNMLAKEAYGMYTSLNGDALTFGSDFQKMVCGNENGRMCQLFSRAVGALPEQNPDYYLSVLLRRMAEFITENFSAMIFSLPSITLNFFVMLFVMYYSLKDHRLIIANVSRILPLRYPHKLHVLRKFRDVSFAVFYGHLFVALLQGIIAGLGYALLGVKSPFLWAALTALFALLPFIGTAFIWLPLAANFFLKWHIEGDAGFAVRGIILILYGILAVGSIDNFVRPKIISRHAEVHPVLVLLGVLGGLSLFGFVGLILGPVMLALLMILVKIYEEEKTEIRGYFR